MSSSNSVSGLYSDDDLDRLIYVERREGFPDADLTYDDDGTRRRESVTESGSYSITYAYAVAVEADSPPSAPAFRPIEYFVATRRSPVLSRVTRSSSLSPVLVLAAIPVLGLAVVALAGRRLGPW